MKFDIDKPLPGLYSVVECAVSPTVKRRARAIFAGWERGEFEIHRWINCHRRGYTAVAGDMIPCGWTGRLTHGEPLWRGTSWGFLDLDNDEIPLEKSVAVTDPRAIHVIDPEVDNLLFAIAESVSSRWETPDGIVQPARWHGVFCLEEPVTDREQYRYLLTGMQAKLKSMTGKERNPAQPCFGNGRQDAYVVEMENVISTQKAAELMRLGKSLSGGFREPAGKAERRSATSVPKVSAGPAIPMGRFRGECLRRGYDGIEPKALRAFCERWQVPIHEGGKLPGDGGWIYYIPCPFERGHDNLKSPTDAFLRVYPDRTFTFRCFHNSCQERGCGRSSPAAAAWEIFKAAMTCPIRTALKAMDALPLAGEIAHDDGYRYYHQMPCARDAAHRGRLVYRECDEAKYFLCPHSGCAPMGFKDYLRARWGAF